MGCARSRPGPVHEGGGLAGLLALWISAQAAGALELRTLSDQPIAWSDRLNGRCTHTLTGMIEAGDLARVQAAIDALPGQDHDDRNFIICLDSPGGNLNEGFEIGCLLRQNLFGTYVDAGAECLSACAIAFMHGQVAAFEYFSSHRVLHSAGRLGFHAPSLTLGGQGDDMVPLTLVDAAYTAALKTLSSLVEGAISGSGSYDIIPSNLLNEMLATPPDQMRYVETLRDAFSWKIDILPHGLRAPEDFDLDLGYYQLCANLFFSIPADTMLSEVVTPAVVAFWSQEAAVNPPPVPAGSTLILLGEVQQHQCLYKYNAQAEMFELRGFVEGTQIGSGGLPPVYMFSPDVRLADIAP